VSGIAVRADGLTLDYGPRRAVADVSFALAPGERVCLAGPNGAGKSSLLRCITGLAAPTAGGVTLDGTDVRALGRERRARLVAVVPGQAAFPFAMRVDEIVALGRVPYATRLGGLRAADLAAVASAMERAGVAHLADRDARTLSLGERQLVLIAVALAQGGRFLVLDEPTVHLDLRHQLDVMDLLARLAEREGITVLAVLHDLALAAATFPRLLLLRDGRLVGDGPPAEVLAPERIREVYGVDPARLPQLPGAVASPA